MTHSSQEGAGLSEDAETLLMFDIVRLSAMVEVEIGKEPRTGDNIPKRGAVHKLIRSFLGRHFTDRDAAIKRQFHDIMELRSRLSASEADNARLREALKFYGSLGPSWRSQIYQHKEGVTWWPTEALQGDLGRRADEALRTPARSDTGEK